MNKKIVKIRKGQYLFHENDFSKELFILQKGKIQIYRMEGYKKIELEVVVPGGVLGEMAVIDGKSRSASALILEDSELIVISPEDFAKAINDIPPWFYNIVKIIVQRLRHANKRIEANIIKNNISNIANLLVFLLSRHKEGSQNILDLKLAKREIIEMLGLVDRDLSQVLADFQQKNLLEIKNNKIIIPDHQRIEEFAKYIRNKQLGKKIPRLEKISLKLIKFLFSFAEEEKFRDKTRIVINTDHLVEKLNEVVDKDTIKKKDFLKELLDENLISLEESPQKKENKEGSLYIYDEYANKNIVFEREKIEDALILSNFESSFKDPDGPAGSK